MAAHTASINSSPDDDELLPLMTSPSLRQDSPLSEDFSVPKQKGLGLFEGVFVPCVLSIFSVVLFLRMGFIIGQAGLLLTLGMLIIAYFIVFLTVLSISAISTNGIVKGGGAYFMISRSLGPEFGGSIGIVFYFANVFSSALYVSGFVESLTHNVESMPSGTWFVYAYSTGVALFCLAITIAGAKAFAKASLLIFAVVIIAVFTVAINFTYAKANHGIKCPQDNSINDTFPGQMDSCLDNGVLSYTQIDHQTFKENLAPRWTFDYTTGDKQDLQTVFAILFNGCTGIMAGANISGDLANASRSIPYGTMAASGFTFLVYVLLFSLTASACTPALLLNDYSYMQDINPVPYIVIAGIFAATLSAALSTLIGASRILQALSRDRLLGPWTAFFCKEKTNPVRAVLVSWFFVQLVLLIGSVNVIAPIVSMFYLISYAITNFACFALAITGAPNFRPTFRYFTWHTALAGFVGCITVMYYVNVVYAAAVSIMTMIFWVVIHLRHLPVDWGDVTQALMYHQVRKYLLRISKTSDGLGKKYWRPQFLFIVSEPKQCLEAICFLNDMKKGGLLVLGKVLRETESADNRAYMDVVTRWVNLARICKVKSFIDVVMVEKMKSGVRQLLYCSGLGSMRPNIVVYNLFDSDVNIDQVAQYRRTLVGKTPSIFGTTTNLKEFDATMNAFENAAERTTVSPTFGAEDYVSMLRDTLELQKALGVMRHMERIHDNIVKASSHNGQSHIDVWIFDFTDSTTYELLLQLGTILHSTARFRKITKLRVLTASSERTQKRDALRVKSILDGIRVKAEIQCRLTPYAEAIHRGQCSQEVNIQLNALMKAERNTCVILSELPQPPADNSQAKKYIADVKTLTEGLSPVLLFRGVDHVVTTLDEGI